MNSRAGRSQLLRWTLDQKKPWPVTGKRMRRRQDMRSAPVGPAGGVSNVHTDRGVSWVVQPVKNTEIPISSPCASDGAKIFVYANRHASAPDSCHHPSARPSHRRTCLCKRRIQCRIRLRGRLLATVILSSAGALFRMRALVVGSSAVQKRENAQASVVLTVPAAVLRIAHA